ncbi:MAG: VOC family protein [Chloroflexota bacterium]
MGNPVVHFEVLGQDPAKLQQFYREAFGWTINADNPMNYGMVQREGAGIGGGIAGLYGESEPVPVTFYIEVDDLQAALNRIEQLGGKTLTPPVDVPGGPSIAHFSDPEGHRIGLAKGM